MSHPGKGFLRHTASWSAGSVTLHLAQKGPPESRGLRGLAEGEARVCGAVTPSPGSGVWANPWGHGMSAGLENGAPTNREHLGTLMLCIAEESQRVGRGGALGLSVP